MNPCCDGGREVTGDSVAHQTGVDQRVLHHVVNNDLANVDDASARNVRERA